MMFESIKDEMRKELEQMAYKVIFFKNWVDHVVQASLKK